MLEDCGYLFQVGMIFSHLQKACSVRLADTDVVALEWNTCLHPPKPLLLLFVEALDHSNDDRAFFRLPSFNLNRETELGNRIQIQTSAVKGWAVRSRVEHVVDQDRLARGDASTRRRVGCNRPVGVAFVEEPGSMRVDSGPDSDLRHESTEPRDAILVGHCSVWDQQQCLAINLLP